MSRMRKLATLNTNRNERDNSQFLYVQRDEYIFNLKLTQNIQLLTTKWVTLGINNWFSLLFHMSSTVRCFTFRGKIRLQQEHKPCLHTRRVWIVWRVTPREHGSQIEINCHGQMHDAILGRKRTLHKFMRYNFIFQSELAAFKSTSTCNRLLL